MENHQSKIGGHKGVNKTYKRIRERFFWPGIKEQVTEFVRRCNTCQEQKIIRAKTHEPMIITDTPIDTFDKVSLDTVGPLPTTSDGNKHLLTMQDNLSKYCLAVHNSNNHSSRLGQKFNLSIWCSKGHIDR